MLTAGLNTLALARIETIQLLHGQCDGLLLMGLAAASSAILTIVQPHTQRTTSTARQP